MIEIVFYFGIIEDDVFHIFLHAIFYLVFVLIFFLGGRVAFPPRKNGMDYIIRYAPPAISEMRIYTSPSAPRVLRAYSTASFNVM